jgi:hypothetical protein
MKIQDYETYIANSISGSVGRTPYLPDVHDFPSVHALRDSISRSYVGAGQQEYVQQFILRAYTHSSIERAIETSEDIARQIEYYTAHFIRDYLFAILTTQLGLSTQDAQELSTQDMLILVTQNIEFGGGRVLRDARVLSITTDEGFLAPYSLCEVEIEFSYDYTNTSGYPVGFAPRTELRL